jgi:hypothetical protein
MSSAICWKKVERLQDLLADDDLFGAVAVRQRGEAGADGVADSFLEQHADGGGGGDDAL